MDLPPFSLFCQKTNKSAANLDCFAVSKAINENHILNLVVGSMSVYFLSLAPKWDMHCVQVWRTLFWRSDLGHITSSPSLTIFKERDCLSVTMVVSAVCWWFSKAPPHIRPSICSKKTDFVHILAVPQTCIPTLEFSKSLGKLSKPLQKRNVVYISDSRILFEWLFFMTCQPELNVASSNMSEW